MTSSNERLGKRYSLSMIQLEIEQLVAAFDALDSGVVVLDHDKRVVC